MHTDSISVTLGKDEKEEEHLHQWKIAQKRRQAMDKAFVTFVFWIFVIATLGAFFLPDPQIKYQRLVGAFWPILQQTHPLLPSNKQLSCPHFVTFCVYVVGVVCIE